MGLMAFQWGEKQLTLLQNRENFDTWETKPLAWDERKQILRGLPENNFGTWCGISRRGRVAFLADALLPERLSPSVLHPLDFLRGEMSPWDFASKWSANSTNAKIINHGLAYYMIVADINSNCMFYISKKTANETHVHTKEVDFGVHTLSSSGLDSQLSEVLHMNNIFCKMIGDYKKKDLPSLKKMAEEFIYDPVEADKMSASSSSSVDVFKETFQKLHETMSTTALSVEPNKEVKLYERYLENDQWKDHDFAFDMD